MAPTLLPLLLAALAATTSALTTPLPRIQVTLTPEFSAPNTTTTTTTITALDITLHLSHLPQPNTTSPPPPSHYPLLQLDLNHGLTPTQQYNDTSLSASDTLGPLPLTHTDSNATDAQRTWFASRNPHGPVLVQFRAVPRVVDKTTPSGPRIDLRADESGEGLVGMGAGFLPLPLPLPLSGVDGGDGEWEVVVQWVVPEGLRVASSLGDRVRETVVGVPGRVLAKAYFAVGALRRWPGWEVEVGEGEREFYVYWLGELPYDSERMAGIAKDMHGAIASFFGDVDTPFRVFWRRALTGYGGAGGYNSFLLEFSDGTDEEQSEEAATFLLSHEGIHEYALMSPARQYDMWYREGVAQFYAVVAPFAAGAVDKSYLIRWLNNNAQSYYTSGMAGKTWQSIIDNYWTSTQNVKAPYGTGFVYLAQVQGLIAKATNGTKDLDDLTLELYRRFVAHDKVQTDEFLEVLSGLVGSEAAEASLSAMLNGTFIVPAADSFAKFGLKMVKKDAELFELGFLPSQGKVASFTSNRTRAEEAGLRVGDEIIRMWGEWGASDSLDNMMRVVVRRDGSEVNVDYWPRSYEKVENWVWEEDDTVTNQS